MIVELHDAIDGYLLPSVFRREVFKSVFVGIVEWKSAIGSYPYLAQPVGGTAADYIVANAVWVVFIVLINGKVVAVVFIQPVIGGEPHVSLFILCDAEYGTLRKPFIQTDVDELDRFYVLWTKGREQYAAPDEK